MFLRDYACTTQGDITSSDFMAYVLKEKKIEVIFHLAAQTHVDNSFGDSFEFTKYCNRDKVGYQFGNDWHWIFSRNNVMGTHVMLEAAKVHRVKRFIHVSTDEVYGEVVSRVRISYLETSCGKWSLTNDTRMERCSPIATKTLSLPLPTLIPPPKPPPNASSRHITILSTFLLWSPARTTFTDLISIPRKSHQSSFAAYFEMENVTYTAMATIHENICTRPT